MQNFRKTESRENIAFVTKIEDIPGGGGIAVLDLTQDVVFEGTPVGVAEDGLYHVVKTAKVYEQAANDATAYKVMKGHNFKVGDIIAAKTGGKAYTITAIDSSETDYDTLTVGTTLGIVVAVDDVLFQAASESATTGSAFKYAPVGLTGTSFDIVAGDNHMTDIVVRGTVLQSIAPPSGTYVQNALPLIRFV